MVTSQSQASSQALDPTWLSVPLEKFSFAVSPTGAATHQWVHDTRRDDLFLVFRPVRLFHGDDEYENSMMMSVSAGGLLLERQDIGKLVAIAEEFENRVKKGLVESTLEAPVHVVIKVPCIAVRYPASASTIRRIQMRFKSDLDYQKAVDALKQLNLPMRNAGIKGSSTIPTPLRPASASVLQKSVVYGQHEYAHSRPLSTYPTPRPNGFNSTAYTSPRPLSTGESYNASSDSVRPGSGWSLGSTRPSNATSSVSFEGLFAKSSSAVGSYQSPQFSKNNYPTIVSPLSRITNQLSPLPARPQILGGSTDLLQGKVPLGAFESQLPNTLTSLHLLSNQTLPDELGRLRRTTSAYDDSIIQRQCVGILPERRTSLLPEFLRPVSAPIIDVQQHSSQWLPPRRELPFPKSRSQANSHTSTREVLQNPHLTPLIQGPSLGQSIWDVSHKVHTSTREKGAKRVVQRKDSRPAAALQLVSRVPSPENQMNGNRIRSMQQILAEHVEEPSPLATKSAALGRPSTAPGLRSKATTSTIRKRSNELSTELGPVSKYAKTADRATQTQTLSGRDHTAPLSRTSTHETLLSGSINEKLVQSPLKGSMIDIEAFVSKHKHGLPPQEIWQRPGYTEATAEERQAIINDFICENLDNEDFLKLCEDTADVWRRIGLEMECSIPEVLVHL